MKVLYATQATGNGHLVRALELIPLLRKHVDLDVFVSGTQGQIDLPFEVDFKKYGLSFVCGKKGGISYYRTARSLKLGKLIRDIRYCHIKDYDLLINDFEPITAWSARVKNVSALALSHQSSFWSKAAPRPSRVNRTQEFILRNYAPAKQFMGFHFQRYDENMQLPIISSDIRRLEMAVEKRVSVYLPAYKPELLKVHFKKLDSHEWHIFSPMINMYASEGHVHMHPVGRESWLESFRKSEAVLMGAGFEGPSEALFHEKKLFVIPMRNQYEQLCNAEALKQMGVCVAYSIDADFHNVLKQWLAESEVIQLECPDNTESLVQTILSRA